MSRIAFGLAAVLNAATPAFAEEAPRPEPIQADEFVAPLYTGPLSVHYQPIYCITVPCPPGNYEITGGDEVLAIVDSILFQDGRTTPSTTTRFAGQYLPFETIDGMIWVGADRSSATIRTEGFFVAD